MRCRGGGDGDFPAGLVGACKSRAWPRDNARGRHVRHAICVDPTDDTAAGLTECDAGLDRTPLGYIRVIRVCV